MYSSSTNLLPCSALVAGPPCSYGGVVRLVQHPPASVPRRPPPGEPGRGPAALGRTANAGRVALGKGARGAAIAQGAAEAVLAAEVVVAPRGAHQVDLGLGRRNCERGNELISQVLILNTQVTFAIECLGKVQMICLCYL